MRIWRHVTATLVIVLMALPASPQKTHRPMTGSAGKGPASSSMNVATDLSERLAKWREVRMPFESKGLSAREIKMVNKLVDASRYLEEIFWRQNDPEALQLYQSLGGST